VTKANSFCVINPENNQAISR